MRRWRSQIALLLLCASAAVVASDPTLFESHDLLEVELRGPLGAAIEDVDERNERAFVLAVEGRELGVTARVRGNSRVRVCRFPPLRLDFSAADTNGTAFAGQRKLKLATHCKGSGDYQQYVLSEYLAYRIFNVISEVGFRVRLLRIRYVDTEEAAADPLVRYGFLIESETELARRVHGKVKSEPHVVKGDLNTQQTAAVFAFQYVIGNTDWSLVAAQGDEYCCHNEKLVEIDGEHFPVPYDFDLAGLVDARYAKPDPSIGIISVRVRRYRGYCVQGLQLNGVFAGLVEQKGEIMELVESVPGITDKSRRKRTKYLEKFFRLADDADELADKLEKRCIDK